MQPSCKASSYEREISFLILLTATLVLMCPDLFLPEMKPHRSMDWVVSFRSEEGEAEVGMVSWCYDLTNVLPPNPATTVNIAEL